MAALVLTALTVTTARVYPLLPALIVSIRSISAIRSPVRMAPHVTRVAMSTHATAHMVTRANNVRNMWTGALSRPVRMEPLAHRSRTNIIASVTPVGRGNFVMWRWFPAKSRLYVNKWV